MAAPKLIKIEAARDIIEETLNNFQWKAKEVPLHQCLGMYLSEDFPYEEKTGEVGYGRLNKGQRIRPIEVSLLADLGKILVPVFEKPLISIISVGDELVSIIEEPMVGKVRDSNSFALAALIQETGCDLGGVYLISDDKETLKSTMQEALERTDLVIVSGGTSRDGQGITAKAIQEIGAPGVLVDGLDLNHCETTVIGIIEDTHCACCTRKSLIAGLPGDASGVFASYKELVDGLIKRIFFSC